MKKGKSLIFFSILLIFFLYSFQLIAAEDNHDEHADHHEDELAEGHEDHEEEHAGEENVIVVLSEEQIKAAGIEVSVAGKGTIAIQKTFPGVVKIDEDRLTHIVPRVGGIAVQVLKKVGDNVKESEILAIIESRELAEVKAEYLAALEKCKLAKATFEREEKLKEKGVSSVTEYLESKKEYLSDKIEKNLLKSKLLAIGFSDEEITKLEVDNEKVLTRYEIKSPFDGVIIEKHITRGEVLHDESEAFVVADLSTVWIDLNIYQKDLPYLETEQDVDISDSHNNLKTEGKISFISPIIDEETRTAVARVYLKNTNRKWRPGLFVTGVVATSQKEYPVVIIRTAIQRIDEEYGVFVPVKQGYELRHVEIGSVNETHAQILSGLQPGQKYVTKGAFELKSEIVMKSLDSHAGHGH